MDPDKTTDVISTKPKMSIRSFLRILIFTLALLSIPALTIYFGQLTRKQIKADVTCKSPAVPDPADCVGGLWQLNKDENGCIHFVCKLR